MSTNKTNDYSWYIMSGKLLTSTYMAHETNSSKTKWPSPLFPSPANPILFVIFSRSLKAFKLHESFSPRWLKEGKKWGGGVWGEGERERERLLNLGIWRQSKDYIAWEYSILEFGNKTKITWIMFLCHIIYIDYVSLPYNFFIHNIKVMLIY